MIHSDWEDTDCRGTAWVIDSRQSKLSRRRRYKCDRCPAKWSTVEVFVTNKRGQMTAKDSMVMAVQAEQSAAISAASDFINSAADILKDLKREGVR